MVKNIMAASLIWTNQLDKDKKEIQTAEDQRFGFLFLSRDYWTDGLNNRLLLKISETA